MDKNTVRTVDIAVTTQERHKLASLNICFQDANVKSTGQSVTAFISAAVLELKDIAIVESKGNTAIIAMITKKNVIVTLNTLSLNDSIIILP